MSLGHYMEKIPFTTYDFWAYLSAGFLLLFVTDHVAGTGLFARESWTTVQGVVAVTSAYAVGQLVASTSSLVFERFLVGGLLGYPSKVLFGYSNAPNWLRACIPSYFKSLPDESKKRALEGVMHSRCVEWHWAASGWQTR